MGVPSNRQQILYQGKLLNDKDKLDQKGIHDGQLLYLTVVAPKPVPQQQGGGGMSIADMIKNFDKSKGQNMMNFRFPEKKLQDFMPSA